MSLQPFHLAMPVRDLEETRNFYGVILGCKEGRSAARWVDFDLFGHQLSFHITSHREDAGANPVDGDAVPIPHFGVVLTWEDWHQFRDRLVSHGVTFEIEPKIRFAGQAGEQATLFFRDPAGNALEFKSFRNPESLFAT